MACAGHANGTLNRRRKHRFKILFGALTLRQVIPIQNLATLRRKEQIGYGLRWTCKRHTQPLAQA